MHLRSRLKVIQMAEVFSRVVLEGCKEAESRWELSDIPWKDQMKVFCWILTSLFKKFCPSPITIPKDVHCPPSSPDWSLSPEVSKHQAPVVTNSYWKHPTVLLQEKTTHEKFWTCSISDAFLNNSVRGDTLPVLQAEGGIAKMSQPQANWKPTTPVVNHLPVKDKMTKLISCNKKEGVNESHLLVVPHSDLSALPGYVHRHRAPGWIGEIAIGNSQSGNCESLGNNLFADRWDCHRQLSIRQLRVFGQQPVCG